VVAAKRKDMKTMNKENKIDAKFLNTGRFPRSSKYDMEWMLANEMGPNAVWFAEELSKHMALQQGFRVLDMGCGRAMTSIFLAKEFGVNVFATDLWVSPDDNWQQVQKEGCENSVFPVHAEARNLPYAKNFFDAIVSVDSYQYYGTDDLYLAYMTRFLKEAGLLGIVVPAVTREFETPPEHLTRIRESGRAFWDPSECWCFHTLEWWKRHFSRTEMVDIVRAEYVPDGWRLWRDWELIRDGGGFSGFPSEAPTLEEDAGRNIGFVLLVVKKRPSPDSRFDHSLKIRL
jgi:cyclopropane fatty-acyl-phospholipid synthase-like methyltransferase